MKSEHRHELQTNELGKVIDKARGFFDVYGNHVMIGVLAASVIASGLIFWVRSSRNNEAAAWTELALARNAEDYYDIWERHKGTDAAVWARLHEGEARLETGVQALFNNVKAAEKDLNQARAAFKAVIGARGAAKEAREQAMYCLAVTIEATSSGDESEAIQAYEALVKEFPDSVYVKRAKDRIAALGSGSGQEFYTWFASYKRPESTRREPRDMGSDEDSNFSEDLERMRDRLKSRKSEAGEEEEMEAPEKDADENETGDKDTEEKELGKDDTEKSDDGDSKGADEDNPSGDENRSGTEGAGKSKSGKGEDSDGDAPAGTPPGKPASDSPSP